MPASDFAGRMEWQSEAVAREMRSVPMGDLLNKEITFGWGETQKRGEGLAHPLRWLVGYRMQLFLYLKAAGNIELKTNDCWHLPKPATPAA
jgi:hypothetical protein